jgi:hypothetical protein
MHSTPLPGRQTSDPDERLHRCPSTLEHEFTPDGVTWECDLWLGHPDKHISIGAGVSW